MKNAREKQEENARIEEDTDSEQEKLGKEEEEKDNVHEEGKYEVLGDDERRKQVSALFADPSKGNYT